MRKSAITDFSEALTVNPKPECAFRGKAYAEDKTADAVRPDYTKAPTTDADHFALQSGNDSEPSGGEREDHQAISRLTKLEELYPTMRTSTSTEARLTK